MPLYKVQARCVCIVHSKWLSELRQAIKVGNISFGTLVDKSHYRWQRKWKSNSSTPSSAEYVMFSITMIPQNLVGKGSHP